MANFETNISKDGSHTFHWGILGSLLVSYTFPGEVSVSRFSEYLKVIREKEIRYLLSITEGTSTINSVQRKQAADLAREKDLRIAVVLDSAITRGLITAFSWLGVSMKSFAPGKLDDAIRYLDVQGVSSTEITTAVQQIEKESRLTRKP